MELQSMPAPGLREVAETRWDVARDPVVAWSREGRTFWLTDPEEPDSRVRLAVLESPPADPAAVATALAETVASCDFPPTDDHASRPRVIAALQVAGFGHLELAPDPAGRDDAGPAATTTT